MWSACSAQPRPTTLARRGFRAPRFGRMAAAGSCSAATLHYVFSGRSIRRRPGRADYYHYVPPSGGERDLLTLSVDGRTVNTTNVRRRLLAPGERVRALRPG